MEGEGHGGGYLPPEPSGREPDLGPGEPPPPPPPPPAAAPASQWQQPPQAGQWQQPPQQPWAYAQQPQVPDNGPAVAGFVLSLIGGGLLLVSGGLSTLVSVVCAAVGIFYSVRGRRRVDRGETPKHRGLAQAGFIIGIVSLVLAVLATLAYGAILILYLTNDEFQEDLERELELDTQSSTILLAVVALRLSRGALSVFL